jgi:hypothetical protein
LLLDPALARLQNILRDKHHPQIWAPLKEVLVRNELYGFGVEREAPFKTGQAAWRSAAKGTCCGSNVQDKLGGMKGQNFKGVGGPWAGSPAPNCVAPRQPATDSRGVPHAPDPTVAMEQTLG